MSRPFKNYSGKAAFDKFQEPMNAGDYVLNKKASTVYCQPNICHPNRNINSQSNLQMLKKANVLKYNPIIPTFDKTSLYINLYTQLNLENICTITDLSGNCQIPITTTVPYINPSLPTYNNYIIDPSGTLFGNTTCGINNFTDFIIYNK